MNEKLRRIITAFICAALAAAMLAGCAAPVNTAEPEVTPDIIVTAEPTAAPAETAPAQTAPTETQAAETAKNTPKARCITANFPAGLPT